jgi:predicted glycosyltransferase
VPLKVFIYAQDTLGLGHVKRCATLARALLSRRADAAVLLASKSAWAATVSLGDRFDFLKLPAQLTLPASSDADREAERSAIRALRRDLLCDAVSHFRPQLIVVDNEPLGYGGEMAAALASAGSQATVVFGMRDVMDDPERISEVWESHNVIEALEERFDRILIYGHPDVFDTLGTYALPASLADRARYTGYICSRRDGLESSSVGAGLGFDSQPLMLVTGGGGQDALPLFSAVLEALPLLMSEPEPRALLVTGPFMPAEERERVAALADSSRCQIRETTDVVEAMAAARAVATMGGYNTLVEAMMVGRRPVVVPRATHKREQLMRAQAFEARGLVRCIPPARLSPAVMATALQAELEAPTTVDAAEYLDPDAGRAAELLLEVVA